MNHIGMNKITNTEFIFFTISEEKKMRRLWIRLISIWIITLSIYYLSQCVMPNVVTDKKDEDIAVQAQLYKVFLSDMQYLMN